MNKQCIDCGESKSLDGFHRLSRAADGRRSRCKDCRLERYHKRMADPDYAARERIRLRAKNRRRWREDPAYRKQELTRRRSRPWPVDPNAAVYKRVHRAIEAGLLVPAEHCERCGHDFSEYKREAHHADYSKPLEVEWLCKLCHGKEHRKQDVA